MALLSPQRRHTNKHQQQLGSASHSPHVIIPVPYALLTCGPDSKVTGQITDGGTNVHLSMDTPSELVDDSGVHVKMLEARVLSFPPDYKPYSKRCKALGSKLPQASLGWASIHSLSSPLSSFVPVLVEQAAHVDTPLSLQPSAISSHNFPTVIHAPGAVPAAVQGCLPTALSGPASAKRKLTFHGTA